MVKLTKGKDGPATRLKLVEVVTEAIRQKGYAGTSVDEVCALARVSKGSFFHHFSSKEDLAIAAAEHWGARTGDFFAQAPYQANSDPRDRLQGYLDFRIEIIGSEITRFTCYLGTVVQEVHASHPRLRSACDHELSRHVDSLARDLAVAKALYAPKASWEPQTTGTFIQSALQGGFILAKAQQDAAVAIETVRHLKRYLEALLGPSISSTPIAKKS
jgi:TetR/AcrR family transcriptional repressor of nem operon